MDECSKKSRRDQRFARSAEIRKRGRRAMLSSDENCNLTFGMSILGTQGVPALTLWVSGSFRYEILTSISRFCVEMNFSNDSLEKVMADMVSAISFLVCIPLGLGQKP